MRTPVVTHETETITPVIAIKYLDHNNRNRPLDQRQVKKLADDMEAGRWQENGVAGVTFDWNGEITDGQHTLHAVIKSNVTIRCRVTRGVAPESRSTSNDGLKQRFSHDLAIDGVNSAMRVEALLRKVLVWEKVAEANNGSGGLAKWQQSRFSRAELAEKWPLYATGIARAIHECYRWKDEWTLVGNAGALEFTYWLLVCKNQNNPATVQDFFDRMATGSQDDEDKVLTRVKIRMKRKPCTAPYQVFWMIKGWNAWVQEKSMSKLQLPDGGELVDPFPKLAKAR